MSVLYKALNKQGGTLHGAQPTSAAPYKPQTLHPSHERMDGHRTRVALPRRPGPLLFLLLLCGLYAGLMLYVDTAPPPPLPSAPPPVIPIVAQPSLTPDTTAQDIDTIASFMPQAVAAPLPLDGKSLPPSSARPHITVTAAPTPVEDASNLIRQGVRQAQDGQRDAALASFARARELAPTDPRPTYNMAVLYDRIGERPAALKAYRETIALLDDAPDSGLNAKAIAARYNQLNADAGR